MSRSIILYLTLLVSVVSCDIAKTDPDSGFVSLLSEVESDPRLYLEKHGESGPFNLSDAGEAERFLLRSLSRNYIDRECFPSRDSLQAAIETFGSGKHTKALLESLFLLAEMHEHHGELEDAVMIIGHLVDLSKDMDDIEWQFYLYSHVSYMYMRNFNMMSFVRYQKLANEIICGIAPGELGVETKVTALMNYILADSTGLASRFVESLDSDNITPENPFYSEYRRLRGKYLYRTSCRAGAILDIEESLAYETDSLRIFECHAMLMALYYDSGDIEKSFEHRDAALECVDENTLYYKEIQFYRNCSDYSREQRCEEEYRRFTEMLACKSSRMHSDRLVGYLTSAVLFLLVSLVLTVVYFRSRRRSMSRLIEFQKKITELENLKESLSAKNAESGEMVKSYIKRDIEVAKNLARTEYASAEKGEWMFNELFRTSALKDNELALRQWEKFYRQIDICYDGFHTKLLQRYPSLSERDVQLCCMLLVGMKTEEIAGIWNKSNFTVQKCRSGLRKKLQTGQGADIADFLRKVLS